MSGTGVANGLPHYLRRVLRCPPHSLTGWLHPQAAALDQTNLNTHFGGSSEKLHASQLHCGRAPGSHAWTPAKSMPNTRFSRHFVPGARLFVLYFAVRVTVTQYCAFSNDTCTTVLATLRKCSDETMPGTRFQHC
eukprot:3688553-Rhodomonas_salina.1